MESITNSKEYWEMRFRENWEANMGTEQTQYFAQLLCDNLPQWFIEEVSNGKYTICDIGCAEGDALPIFNRKFLDSQFLGEDFSQEAVNTAKRRHSKYTFTVSDILQTEGKEQYPVVVCSNVVEHFSDTLKTISKIMERSSLYTVFLIPFREPKGIIDEHEVQLYTKSFPLFLEGNHLVYAKSIECKSIYYELEQLLLIYSKKEGIEYKLSHLTEEVVNDNCLTERKQAEERQKAVELEAQERQRIAEREAGRRIASLENITQTLEAEKEKIENTAQEWEDKYRNLYIYSCNRDEELHDIKSAGYYKLAVKLLLPVEKIWIRARDKKDRIVLYLNQKEYREAVQEIFSPINKVKRFLLAKIEKKIAIKKMKKEFRGKRVIIFPPTIDWSMPLFQRPQQLALSYSKKEDLKVLYITKNIKYDDVALAEKVGENLWLCNELYIDSVLECIHSAREVIVSLSWTLNKAYLDKIKPDKFIYEYIDELEIFYGYGPEMEEDHSRFIKNADVTVCTATKLYDQVKSCAKNPIISTNAGDYDFFVKTREYEINELIRDKVEEYDCVIGYYGSLAKWFDYELVKKVAEKRKGWLWILVGVDYDHTLESSGILNHENVLYIQPQPYKTLPTFLKAFDIATIPFVINEITLSTSPVKLFEYMAAGKPIIASKLPECLKYESVKTYTDAEEFIEYAEQFIEMGSENHYWSVLEQDARNNTWEKKTDEILEAVERVERNNNRL